MNRFSFEFFPHKEKCFRTLKYEQRGIQGVLSQPPYPSIIFFALLLLSLFFLGCDFLFFFLLSFFFFFFLLCKWQNTTLLPTALVEWRFGDLIFGCFKKKILLCTIERGTHYWANV